MEGKGQEVLVQMVGLKIVGACVGASLLRYSGTKRGGKKERNGKEKGKGVGDRKVEVVRMPIWRPFSCPTHPLTFCR